MKEIMNKLLKSNVTLGYEEPKGNFLFKGKDFRILKGAWYMCIS